MVVAVVVVVVAVVVVVVMVEGVVLVGYKCEGKGSEGGKRRFKRALPPLFV